MKKIVIATENPHKLREYQVMLEPLKYEVYSLNDLSIELPEETGKTFFENAKQKAKHIRTQTDLPIIADDSGLIVEALDGLPGIKSKRFTEEATDNANNLKLLKLMENEVERTAYFITSVCFIESNGTINHFEGKLHGYIHTKLEGMNGFGYDPLFIPVGYNKTLAELGDDVKNKISHRFLALKKVIDYIETL